MKIRRHRRKIKKIGIALGIVFVSILCAAAIILYIRQYGWG